MNTYGQINNNDMSVTQPPNQFNIAVNQVDNQAAFQIYIISNMLKSRPQFVVCPYCHALNPTRCDIKINYINSCLCLISPTFWIAHQILRDKDLSCYDSSHFCVKCNANLANYTAC